MYIHNLREKIEPRQGEDVGKTNRKWRHYDLGIEITVSTSMRLKLVSFSSIFEEKFQFLPLIQFFVHIPDESSSSEVIMLKEL